MTHKALFRQHWTQAFTEADFCTRLHNAATAAQWSRARWAEELLPRTRRLDCRTVIDTAAEQTDIPEPDGGWRGFVLQSAMGGLYPGHRVSASAEQEDFALCALLAVQLLLAEETAVGALRMMEEHALDGVDAIYGVHVWGTYDAPGIAFPAGNLMACCHGFTIEVEGKSAHASAPHEGVDAVMVASSILQSIQQLVSRMNDPLNPLVITVGKVTAGNRWNVLAGHATLEGTVRTFLTGTQVEDALRKVAECTAAAFGAKATLSYQYMTEPVINGDEQLNRIAQTAVTKLYGKESLITPAPLMGSEDFSWFGKDGIPYIYGFVASHNKDWDYMYGNHHEKYDVDETILHRGAAVAAQFAADYLAETAQQ